MLQSPAPGMDRLAKTIELLKSRGFERAMFDFVRSFIHADNETVVVYEGNLAPRILHSFSTVRRVHDRLETDYVRGSYLLDPFYALHVDRREPGLYALKQIAPDQFKRSEYYSTYFRRTTVVDEMVFAASPAPNTSVHLSIGRDAASGLAFSKREEHNAKQIAGVVTALAAEHWSTLSAAEAKIEEADPNALRAQLLHDQDISLTPRQAQVALMILRGHSSTSISLELGISGQTVKVFRKQLYRNCQISSQAELFSMLTPVLFKIAGQRKTS